MQPAHAHQLKAAKSPENLSLFSPNHCMSDSKNCCCKLGEKLITVSLLATREYMHSLKLATLLPTRTCAIIQLRAP
jgi:hypothetical protein